MIAAALAAHAEELTLCAAGVVLALVLEGGHRTGQRRRRRHAARIALLRARAGTAQQDAAAIAAQAVREGWTDPTEGATDE